MATLALTKTPGTHLRALQHGLVIGIFVAAAWGFTSFLTCPRDWIAHDLWLYQDHVKSILAGGPVYPAYELSGPYEIVTTTILYPPIAMIGAALSLLMPLPLYYLIPLVIVTAAVLYLRPAWWALVLIGLALAFPVSVRLIIAGNPDMWFAAALALALAWRPAAAFVLLKPSVLPLALIGVRSRGWWIVAGVFALVSLVLLSSTLDWLKAIANARGARSGLLYSLEDVPLLAVPIVAWLGSSRFRGLGDLAPRRAIAKLSRAVRRG